MSQKPTPDTSRLDALLDLLADEVAARLAEREAGRTAAPPAAPRPSPIATPAPASPAAPPTPPAIQPVPARVQAPRPSIAPRKPMPPHAGRFLRRLALALLGVLVLINAPLLRGGRTLATAVPDSRSLALREGLVVKPANADEIYVYRDGPAGGGAFHWISSMTAFKHYGWTWDDVHVVDDDYLAGYEIGVPQHVLVKAADSPHIYRLEGAVKRWIVDIPTLEAEGHVWDDVAIVDVAWLRSVPDGETIPPGRGPAPRP